MPLHRNASQRNWIKETAPNALQNNEQVYAPVVPPRFIGPDNKTAPAVPPKFKHPEFNCSPLVARKILPTLPPAKPTMPPLIETHRHFLTTFLPQLTWLGWFVSPWDLRLHKIGAIQTVQSKKSLGRKRVAVSTNRRGGSELLLWGSKAAAVPHRRRLRFCGRS